MAICNSEVISPSLRLYSVIYIITRITFLTTQREEYIQQHSSINLDNKCGFGHHFHIVLILVGAKILYDPQTISYYFY